MILDTGIKITGRLGSVFVGNTFGAILFGISSMQALTYFKGSQDRWPFKFLIGFLWILDATQTAFMTAGVYYLILNFVNHSAHLVNLWTILSLGIMTCLSDFIVRCILARRIWLLSGRNKPLVFSIIFIALVVFLSGVALTIRGMLKVSFTTFIQESWLFYIALGGLVSADILIATSICVHLYHSRSGFNSSDSLIKTLMLYSINTCILTSLCAIACLISFAIWPRKLLFLGIYFVLGKLYINTILAVLNNQSFPRTRTPGVSTICNLPKSTVSHRTSVVHANSICHASLESHQGYYVSHPCFPTEVPVFPP